MEVATITEREASGTVSLAGALPASADMLDSPRRARIAARHHYFRGITGLLEDVVLLMLAVLLVPLAILVVGAPIALCVRAVIEIVRRFL